VKGISGEELKHGSLVITGSNIFVIIINPNNST